MYIFTYNDTFVNRWAAALFEPFSGSTIRRRGRFAFLRMIIKKLQDDIEKKLKKDD